MALSSILSSLFSWLGEGNVLFSLCAHLPGNIWIMSAFQHWTRRSSLFPFSDTSHLLQSAEKTETSTLKSYNKSAITIHDWKHNVLLDVETRRHSRFEEIGNRGWVGWVGDCLTDVDFWTKWTRFSTYKTECANKLFMHT